MIWKDIPNISLNDSPSSSMNPPLDTVSSSPPSSPISLFEAQTNLLNNPTPTLDSNDINTVSSTPLDVAEPLDFISSPSPPATIDPNY